MWRALRISVLGLLLLAAAGVTWGDRFRSTRWTEPLWIGVFPVDADGRPATADYIAGLDAGRYADVEAFIAREARRHGVATDRPVRVELHPPVAEPPPAIEPGTGPLGTALWSLRLRGNAWRVARGKLADVRLFVLYHDPEASPVLPHSLGLQKGLVGVVHAFADRGQDGSNGVVIAHEFLHTVGATDKYDPVTLEPLYPQGYAEPAAGPGSAQEFAEIMAGRRPVPGGEPEIPGSLDEVLVGEATAAEIRWAGR